MRKAMLLLAILGLAGSLWAADPIIGTWKLNIAKSKFPANQPNKPKEGVEVYREVEGNQIELTYTQTGTDGSSGGVSKYRWHAQGGITKCLQDCTEGMSYIETLVEPGNWYATGLQNGQQIFAGHKIVSKDGKTMIQTWKSMDAQGEAIVEVEVFDRQ
jgi:hypothetical protein